MKRIYTFYVIVFLCCCSSAVAQQMAPSVSWSKVFGGSKEDKVLSIINTVDGGVLLVGSSFSNDGDVVGHHGTNTTSDAWVVKLSASGNMEWQRSYGGTGNDDFKAVIRTGDGAYICLGATSSNDGDVSGNHGAEDMWAVKIDRYGNIIWQKTYGGTGNDRGMSICNMSNGTAILQANTNTNNNGDVSNFHYSGSGNFSNDIWIVNINPSNGAINWQRCFGGTFTDNASDVEDGGDGSFVIVGDILSDDGDFGANGGNPPRGKVIKIAPNYSVTWKIANSRWLPVGLAKTIPYHIIYSSQLSVCFPQTGNRAGAATVINGKYTSSSLGYNSIGGAGYGGTCTMSTFVEGTSSVAPVNQVDNLGVAAISEALPNGSYTLPDGVIIGFKSSGSSQTWTKRMGGAGTDQLTSAVALNDNEYVVAGYTNSNNGDITGNHGGHDFWVVKLGKTNTIKGTIFLDHNLNGIKDGNEPYASNILVESKKGSATAASLSYNGFFANSVDTGTYQTKILSAPLYYTAVPSSLSSSFTNYNISDSLGFVLQPIPGKRDYRVHMHSPSAHRPGFDVFYKMRVVNAGTDTLMNRTVKLIKDTRMQFLSSVPVPTAVSGDTISWNIAYLAPRDTTFVNIQLKISPPPVVNINAVLVSTAIIDTTGDLAKVDNQSVFHGFVSGAFDPNDKLEGSGNTFSAADASKGKYFNYTIRFQNTGNDTAFNVVIRDTLDAKLDWSSIEMMDASHPYKLNIIDGNKAEWTFANILLADSNRNEAASHGYINYRIRPHSTVVAGDSIKNSASIYFDFNLPVKTNTQINVIKPGNPPPSPQVSGLLAGYCSNLGVQKAQIANLPAASDGITVTVTLNAIALAVAADSSFSFNVSTLSAGVHTLQVVFANSVAADTLRMNVIVTPAVTPDVNVTANTTTAVNLIDPVVVTASNAAGGGTSPLYTFGKDRNFAALWQAESSNNVLNILATALQAGDNWVYVRMKTSTTCNTSTFNVDSIRISMQLPAPDQPVINGLAANYCNNQGMQKAKLGNYPPQGLGMTTTVRLDGNTLTLAADTSFSFDLSTLSAGNHTVEVSYANSTGTKTTTANFTVTIAATPDVNLASNAGNVGNNEPVIFTASNAAGGGTAPLYAFAKDRNFTNILQAESANNTLILSSATLALGENKMYVRMKTNLSCYTQQTAVDSIVITRFGAAGLIDPDFPNQRISFNPNPFRSRLTIHGLSPTKTYTVTLYSQQGRTMQTIRIKNRSTSVLYVPSQTAGVYMISIYDETKKRLIGTAEVVKQ